MNEKIKEFAQRVNVDIIEPEYAKIGGVYEVNFETYQDLEKFSELIVNECVKVCWDKYRNADSLSQNAGVMFSNDIKKHFGIE